MNQATGHRRDLEAIARRAMTEHGLLPDFSPAALAEVAAIPRPASASDASIRDQRGLLWASIDNDDSLDLDQLTVAEALPDGAAKILVAIADVDELVEKGSAIDDHARHNTTSVYTAAEIFPMLPIRLSTDLTSLCQDEDRLAIVVEMVVGANGMVGSSALYRAIVRNHAKLTYNGVAAWLDGGSIPERVAAVPGLDVQLRMQDRVAQALKGVRQQHGALSLETIEPHAVFEGDVLTALRPDEKNRPKELIEEFMIATNGVTARYLQVKGFASVRRVLRAPKHWERIVVLAAQLQESLPTQPDAAALERFLLKRRQVDPVTFPDLSLSVIKLLGSGEYEVETPAKSASGHFGLAVEDYTHSTAPNRRYPDLITQRSLRAAIAERPLPYRLEELETLAYDCTVQENNAKKVERQVRKSAAALLLEPRIGQEFDGIVTGASDKGTWLRLFQPPVEGKIVQGSAGLDIGDRARVKLLSTNVERGFIDFARVDGTKRLRGRS